MHSVVFFRTAAGHEPAREFIQAPEKEDRQVIGFDLRTVQDGFPIGMPVCRPLRSGLFEVRSTLPSRREARLLFFVDGTLVMVVHGLIKKTEKTPPKDLELARARKAEFEANKKKATPQKP